jgi:hypothetical protein
MTVRPPAVPPWPTRDEFLDWGMVECRGEDCRLLVNPYVLREEFCRGCHRKLRRRKHV